MGKVHTDKLLSLSNIVGLDVLLFLMIGLFMVWHIHKKPHLFWPWLIFVNILGTGPRFRGYMLFDEMFTGFLILGALIKLAMSPADKEPTGAAPLHLKIFFIWGLYMIFESLAGIIINNDIRIFRWVLFYSLLIAIHFTSAKESLFPFPKLRDCMILILFSVSFIFVAYLLQGNIFELDLGQYGRFKSQDLFWAGSSYAIFPTLIGVPAALYLARDPAVEVRTLAWSVLGLCVFVGFYFDSRASYMTILAFLSVYLVRLKFTQIISAGALLLLIFTITSGNPFTKGMRFLETQIFDSFKIVNSPTVRDINRQLQWRAGWDRMTDNPKTLLVGDGVYSHRFTIIPHIERLYAKFLSKQDYRIPGSRNDTGNLQIFRTVGLTALAVDTGLIGITLFVANFILLAIKIFNNPTENKILWLTTLGLGLGWMLISNINDILLLYLLIMPNGIVDQWYRSSRIAPSQLQYT